MTEVDGRVGRMAGIDPGVDRRLVEVGRRVGRMKEVDLGEGNFIVSVNGTGEGF